MGESGAAEALAQALACEKRGRIVTPAWPPTTGTSTSVTSVPVFSAQNVFARTCFPCMHELVHIRSLSTLKKRTSRRPRVSHSIHGLNSQAID